MNAFYWLKRRQLYGKRVKEIKYNPSCVVTIFEKLVQISTLCKVCYNVTKMIHA